MKGGNKYLYTNERESLYIKIGVGDDVVDSGEEDNVNKANIFLNKASKLSEEFLGARTLKFYFFIF